MSAIFLSASIPTKGREFYEDCDPFLIHTAVRELVTAILGKRLLIWGGHPSITPMIWAICEDLGVQFSDACVLYQTRYFEDDFPEENAKFGNVIYVDAIGNGQEASLLAMRQAMLSREDINSAVFIGGMKGIIDEYEIFKSYHPEGKILLLGSTGGATKALANLIAYEEDQLHSVDYAALVYKNLGIDPTIERTIGIKRPRLRPK